MTVTWIGTRTRHDGVFNPAGLGRVAKAPPADGALLARGSLLIEAEVRPDRDPVNLLRFGALDPWPSGLTLCLEADGTVRLMIRQGARHLETALRTGLGAKVQTAHISYVWDAPARRGQLSVHLPDQSTMWQADVMAPFPLSVRDAQRIVADHGSTQMDDAVVFAAIAEGVMPLGPLPGLGGDTVISTKDGAKRLSDIVPGDWAVTKSGEPARVIWAGAAHVPALGRFAPIALRQPYMGLTQDLIAARDQRVCLAGSEVEYLFGEEQVSTAIRHLEARNCAEPAKQHAAVMTYHHILLDTHSMIKANGAWIESFDGAAVLDTSAWLHTSVMADMPEALRPKTVGLGTPVLQGYEALTLMNASLG